MRSTLQWLIVALLCSASASAQTPIGAWVNAGSLSTARVDHTATLLPDGTVLVAGGTGAAGLLQSAELYDPRTHTWSALPDLPFPIARHRAVALRDGRVLLIGGVTSTGPTASCVLFETSLRNWVPAPSLSVPRHEHQALLLDDRRVLVAGGENAAVQSVEIFDPGTDQWTTAPSMLQARVGVGLAVLPDGRVMAAGGRQDASVEIFDPQANDWTALPDPGPDSTYSLHLAPLPGGDVLFTGGAISQTASAAAALRWRSGPQGWQALPAMATPRSRAVIATMPLGWVMIAGGSHQGTVHASTELFDPFTGSWSAGPNLPSPRTRAAAVLLPTGRLLVTGGTDGTSPGNNAWIFDLTAPAWTTAGALSTDRGDIAAEALPDGDVLIVGGQLNNASAALVERGSPEGWSVSQPLAQARSGAGSTLLHDGRVLVAGGEVNDPVSESASSEIFAPLAGSWAAPRPMPAHRLLFDLLTLADGRALAVGGFSSGAANCAQPAFFDPITATWTETGPAVAYPECALKGVLLEEGSVLACADGYVAIFEPETDTWRALPDAPFECRDATHLLLSDGTALWAGGLGQSSMALRQSWLFDPALETWTQAGDLASAREGHGSLRLQSGKVLVGGGWNGTMVPGIELYDPVSRTWSAAPNPTQLRVNSQFVPLPDGSALWTGGFLDLERFAEYEPPPASRPLLDPPGASAYGGSEPWALSGARFTGSGSRVAGAGSAHGGATVVLLARWDGGPEHWLRSQAWSDISIEVGLPQGILPGHYRTRVVVDGVSSLEQPWRVGAPPGTPCEEWWQCGGAGCVAGICGMLPGPDAGVSDGGLPDAGSSDGGEPDAGMADGGTSGGARDLLVSCGCHSGGPPIAALLVMFALAARRRRGVRRCTTRRGSHRGSSSSR